MPQVGWKGQEEIALSQAEADAVVDSIGQEYYRARFEFDPAYATSKGFSDFDDRLTTFAPRRVGGFLKKISRMQLTLERFHQDSLSMDSWIDLNALSSEMATQVFLLEDLELWRRSPLLYSNACISAIYYLALRPDDARSSTNLTSRLAGIPEVVAHARRNLTHPVRLHCEVASTGLKDFLPFLDGIPGVDAETIEQARKTLAGFAAFLDSLAPTADESFALGRESFVKLLDTRNLIRETPEDLAAYAQRVLTDTKARREADGAERRALVDTSGVGDLTPDDIKRYIEAETESARVFVERKDLVTLPPVTMLEIMETPAFLRNLVPGCAYEPPGPLDPDETGLFYIPLPSGMDYGEKLSYLSYMKRRGYAGAIVHETFPGHCLQIASANAHPSFVRKLQDDIFTIEGWAFYCEELMAEQGYYGEHSMSRAFEGIIYRAARVIVDVKLQLGDFSLDEAVDFMVNETGAGRDFVEKEVRRYAVEPGQAMSYLIGKREIETLRDDARKTMGDSFTLRDFHDNVLSCGSLPLYLLRTCVRFGTMERL
ncbi:MAG: DUF885 domain-containing protein [Candidatus Eisenbacteria bacterium]